MKHMYEVTRPVSAAERAAQSDATVRVTATGDAEVATITKERSDRQPGMEETLTLTIAELSAIARAVEAGS